jgi:hypothetical protein
MTFNPHSPIGEDPSAVWERALTMPQQLLWCRALHEQCRTIRETLVPSPVRWPRLHDQRRSTIGLAFAGSAFHQ